MDFGLEFKMSAVKFQLFCGDKWVVVVADSKLTPGASIVVKTFRFN